MGARNIQTEIQGNVVIPLVPRWSKDRTKQWLLHLAENPTLEQLEQFQRNTERVYGEKVLVFSLFALLFKVVSQNVPSNPSLTPEQHFCLFAEIISRCMDLAAKWHEELHAHDWRFTV